MAILLAVAFTLGTGRVLFRRVVSFRVPQSVEEVRTDVFRTFGEHYYVLRFNISKQDLDAIVNSQHFARLGHIRYSAGCVNYGIHANVGTTLVLYGRRRKEPSWLDLREWKNPSAYLVEQEAENCRYKARLLVHDEERGAAYFLEYEVKGHWGGGKFGVTTFGNPGDGNQVQPPIFGK